MSLSRRSPAPLALGLFFLFFVTSTGPALVAGIHFFCAESSRVRVVIAFWAPLVPPVGLPLSERLVARVELLRLIADLLVQLLLRRDLGVEVGVQLILPRLIGMPVDIARVSFTQCTKRRGVDNLDTCR